MKLNERELLDAGWFSLHGEEASRLDLNKSEMVMCCSLGITPAQFVASKDQLSTTEALVNEKKPEAEKMKGLTVDQLELCRQLGVAPEEFWEARQRLINEGFIIEG